MRISPVTNYKYQMSPTFSALTFRNLIKEFQAATGNKYPVTTFIGGSVLAAGIAIQALLNTSSKEQPSQKQTTVVSPGTIQETKSPLEA